MRKILIILLVLIVLALGYLGYAHLSGGAVPTFGLPLGGEKAHIRARVSAFFEHVKFKNTSALKNFVNSDTSEQTLSAFLSKTLGSDEDDVDLLNVKIEQVEVDSTEQRARVRVELNGINLAQKKPFELSRIIFLYRQQNLWLVDMMSKSK